MWNRRELGKMLAGVAAAQAIGRARPAASRLLNFTGGGASGAGPVSNTFLFPAANPVRRVVRALQAVSGGATLPLLNIKLLSRLAVALPLVLSTSGFLHLRGGGGTITPPSTGGTRSVYNSFISSTPTWSTQTCQGSGNTCFPFTNYKGFGIGVVPTGQTVTSVTVGGNPVRFQMDACSFYGDGSLYGARFEYFLPQLASGATEQLTYVLGSGTPCSGTSAGTIADVTGATDYKVQILNDNQVGWCGQYGCGSGTNVPVGTDIGFYVSGGSVTSSYIRTRVGVAQQTCVSTGNCAGTSSISLENCTVAPTYTVNYAPDNLASLVTITNPGSGCPGNATGLSSGNGTCSFNVNSAAGAPAVFQDEKGPLVDGWWVWGPFLDNTSSTPDTYLFCKIHVKRWKDAAGGTYGFTAVGMVTDGVYVHHGVVPPNDMDVDWCNGACGGAGEIRGSLDGSTTTWTRIMLGGRQGFITAGTNGEEDWTHDNSALQAVVSTFTTADKTDLKASKHLPPWDDTLISSLTALVFTNNGFQDVLGSTPGPDEGAYFPLCYCMTDANANDWEGGGSHTFLGPVSANAFNYLITVDAPPSDMGFSQLQALRLISLGIWGVNSGSVEPSTGLPVNQISISTYPTLTPFRPGNVYTQPGLGDLSWTTTGSFQISQGNYKGGNTATYTHYPGGGAYRTIYEIEGKEYELEEMMFDASNLVPTAYHNEVILGTTPYIAQSWISYGGTRAGAWGAYVALDAARYLPATRPEQPYLEDILERGFTTLAAFDAYTGGNIGDNLSNPMGVKTAALTSGIFVPPVSYYNLTKGLVNVGVVPFQDDYVAWVWSQAYNDYGAKYSDLSTLVTNFMNTYQLPRIAAPCVYDIFGYTTQGFLDTGGDSLTGQCSNISCTVARYNLFPWYATLDMHNGSTTVNATLWNTNLPGQTAGGVSFQTSGAAGIGTQTIPMTSVSGLLVPAMVRDCGTSTCAAKNDTGAIPIGTVVDTAISSPCCSIHVTQPIASPGVLSGEHLIFSGQFDYPIGSKIQMPALTLVRPVNIDVLSEATPSAFQRGSFPPNGMSQTGTYYWCPDATYGLVMGTFSTTPACPGTPITGTQETTSPMGWVVNNTCAPISASSQNWNASSSWHSSDGRFAEDRGTALFGQAVFGGSPALTTAITNLTFGAGYPSVIAGNPVLAVGGSYNYGP